MVDGRDAGLTTPADVKLDDVRAGRVRVSMRGYRSAAVTAGTPQIDAGVVLVKLDTAPTGVDVQVAGGYPFEIWEGNRKLSVRSARHELTVEPPMTLRLVAPDVLLNSSVRVDRAGGRINLLAPELGRLTLLTTFETCKVVIGGRDFGYPPLTELALAPGNYEVTLRCPDGDKKTSSVQISAGQTRRETIR